ncbi:transcriptional regulator [Latilactobacillus sakei]|uniref:transcriptional regulator n=1 Tax=Latilactobacillus TaxID=2767885 RepID=UPI00077C7E61|nr:MULTISPECIES: transcriptional regulator [Latilactobacillus]ARJ72634.1 transcriptional regulator [Latilactobacillus sakei]MCT3525614.1 transcriptional regulator [Latilactobacillus curvatus]MDB1552505.1 transcriptional regulator [Latilactobacillus sakei]MDH0600517.1 transcriptional regulator [Latilactobacillus sakei]MDM5044594.1 transcriptional regulator [Latilactobacillus sakei]
MSIYSALKSISNDRNVSIYRIERDLNFVPGKISKWDESTPGADALQEVAEYLGTTSAFLLSQARKEGVTELMTP